LVLLLGSVLTIAAWSALRDVEREGSYQSFRFQVEEAAGALRQRLSAYELTLKSARALLLASDTTTREEWRRFIAAQDVLDRFPGIQGIGYTVVVPPERVPLLERQVQAQGFPAFRIWPEGERPLYSSILYLEPFDRRNRRAFGFDMLSEETRRAAMLIARDTGNTAISGKVQLVQETRTNIQPGFLMYLPYYGQGSVPETVEERRARIQGFIYAPFRVNDFMRTMEPMLEGVRLRLYSGPEPEHLLYDSAESRGDAAAGEAVFDAVLQLDLPGQVWTARFTGGPRALVRDGLIAGRMTSPMLLAAGAVFTLLSFVAVHAGSRLRRVTLRNAQLGRIIEEAATEVYVLNARNLRFKSANRGARQNLGLDAQTLSGLSLLDIQPEIDRRRFVQLVRPLRHGEVREVVYETTHRRRDGSTYQAQVTLQLHHNAEPPVYHALVQDVTERQLRQEALSAALAEAQGLLQEKETLLREVHHRVKNNLQVIWSLIKLEAADIADPDIRSRLETVARRINVLGQIHQQLYGTDNLARVDLAQYLHRLADNLADLHAHRPVALMVEAERLTCDLEYAIPLGLIANELVSNSLEHGFPDDRAGTVAIRLYRDQGVAVLEVADDGRSDRTAPLASGLGLRLVEALVRQLGAVKTVDRSDGTLTRVTLPEGIEH